MIRSPQTKAARCPCGVVFRRPVGKKYDHDTCLSCDISTRLAAAGITAADPAMVHIAAVNAGAYGRAAKAS